MNKILYTIATKIDSKFFLNKKILVKLFTVLIIKYKHWDKEQKEKIACAYEYLAFQYRGINGSKKYRKYLFESALKICPGFSRIEKKLKVLNDNKEANIELKPRMILRI